MSELDSAGSSRGPTIGRLLGISLFTLILLMPRPEGLRPEAQRLLAVTALMSTFWLSQAMPIAATSLIPLVAFPVLGIQGAEPVSQAYINKEVFLFLGGFIIALGLERWGLHERIALHIVRVLGTSPRQVILGFLIATAFISMWISNTATTLMMMPIGIALVRSLKELLHGTSTQHTETSGIDHFGASLVLAIAWAASIGGLTTLVGTVTNVQYQSLWQKLFPDGPRMSAGEWLTAFGPVGLALLICAWAILCWKLPPLGSQRLDRDFFTQRLRSLGRPSRAEWTMLVIFLMTSALWMFRTPLRFGSEPLAPGWESAMQWFLVDILGSTTSYAKTAMHDSTVAIGMALVMFLTPSGQRRDDRPVYMMDWQTASQVPWAIVLLVGGGFAIAGALDQTGLAEWASDAFAVTIDGWPVWAIVLAVSGLMMILTEFATNVVIVSVMLPVLAAVAVRLNLDPRILLLPATIAASYGFMLPIGTPPNAIAFSTGMVSMSHMAKRGALLNVVGVIVLTLATVLYLVPHLGISSNQAPEWAKAVGTQ